MGGMFEIGCLSALDQALPDFRANDFDMYIGTSSGSLVSALVANGVRPEELSHVITNGLIDPYNLRREDVLGPGAGRRAIRRTITIIKTVAKHLLRGIGPSFQEFLARVQQDLPMGLYSPDQLERFIRTMFEAKGLNNRFRELSRELYITAFDLDRAARVVLGDGALADVPISQAIAASSAIPGFFEPYQIGGRDYIDGGVGQVVHADIALAKAADLIVVVNPIVPILGDPEGPSGNGHKRTRHLRGLKYVLEQSARITSHSLFAAGLHQLQLEHPGIDVILIEPAPGNPLLFSHPTMSFDRSREALLYGFKSTMQLLESRGDRIAKILAAHRPVSSSRPGVRHHRPSSTGTTTSGGPPGARGVAVVVQAKERP